MLESGDEPIVHVVPETVPTEALLEELMRRFEAEKRSFCLGYEIRDEDGGETHDIRMGGCGNNSMRFYIAHCVLDWVKKRAGIGFKDE